LIAFVACAAGRLLAAAAALTCRCRPDLQLLLGGSRRRRGNSSSLSCIMEWAQPLQQLGNSLHQGSC
jgi:hypothetical protein